MFALTCREGAKNLLIAACTMEWLHYVAIAKLIAQNKPSKQRWAAGFLECVGSGQMLYVDAGPHAVVSLGCGTNLIS